MHKLVKDDLKKYRLCKTHKDFSKKSKVFCMIPWIHMHILPDSRVISCCTSDFNQELGYLNKQNLKQIWNGKRIRKMRMNMLNELPSEECSRCYEWEMNGGWSLRTEINDKFSNQYDLVHETKKGGYLKYFIMRYIDIRFSNICNFRCRTCDSYLSSSWQGDEGKLLEGKHVFSMLRLNKDAGNLDKYLDKFLNEAEEFYFAGGEPLISSEHYEILDELLSLKRKNVRLVYNTNFSILNYKDKKVLDYWSKFENVSVAASFDAFGPRGELIRKGQDWEKTEKNIKILKKLCPHVKFSVSPTVSILNAWHLPDFHKYMVKKGYIEINDFHLNILLFPPEYRAQVLPKKLKEDVKNKLLKHLEFLINNKGNEKILAEYNQLINFISEKDLSHRFKEFLAKNKKIDAIRNEKFTKIFPEFNDFYGIVDA